MVAATGVVFGEDRRRIGLLQADFGVGVFGGASSGPSAWSIPPSGVGLVVPVRRFAYQLVEKLGWDLSPTFDGGFVSPQGSSSSGGMGTLILVALDSSVSDDAFQGRDYRLLGDGCGNGRLKRMRSVVIDISHMQSDSK